MKNVAPDKKLIWEIKAKISTEKSTKRRKMKIYEEFRVGTEKNRGMMMNEVVNATYLGEI
jgi:hypothetical protein